MNILATQQLHMNTLVYFHIAVVIIKRYTYHQLIYRQLK